MTWSHGMSWFPNSWIVVFSPGKASINCWFRGDPMDWKLPFFGKRKNFNVSKDQLNCSSRIHMVHRDVGKFVLEFLSRLQVMCKHLAVAIISTFGWANCCFGWCDIENFRGYLNLGYTPMLSNLHQNTCTSRAPTDPLGGGLLKGYSKIHWFNMTFPCFFPIVSHIS